MNMQTQYVSNGNDSGLSLKWLHRPKPRKDAKMRIYCFPYAGGNAGVFNDWPENFGDSIEVVAIAFPGRWLRSEENSISCMWQLTKEISDAMEAEMGLDYMFFGHSMGGLLSYQVAQSLSEAGHMLPKHLFVSACEAPRKTYEKKKRVRVDELDEAGLLEHIQKLAGTPREFLQDELMKKRIFASMIPDLTAIDNWEYEESQPLPIDITAFAGKQDDFVNVDGVRDWAQCTTHGFNINLLTGGHFYINEKGRHSVFNTIKRTIELDY
jgi:medium-chain acyl-[acyl-carrier-protein] hydrolase